MLSNNFTNDYNELATHFDSAVENFANSFQKPPKGRSPQIGQSKLFDAMRYSLLSGGKRFRPVLSFAVGQMLELSREQVLPFCLAVECLHTASLIHDDLPALDDDALRRGKPTCHKVFGEAVAVLAADALFGEAFKMISESEGIPSQIRADLCALLAQTLVELCVGQTIEIECGSAVRTEEDLQRIDLKKTASLISAACSGPAVFLGQGREDVFEALSTFGLHLGLLFQITDDILDSSSEVAEKPTYAHVFGIEKAKQLALSERAKALESLVIFGKEAWFLRELCAYVTGRKK